MAGLQSCSDISDIKPLYVKKNLYLKPLLKINISIKLPSLKLVGRSISNITLMENIKEWASPDKFCSIKVTKSTLEFIRFEADLLNPSKVQAILARLDGRMVTLTGFKEQVKVRASITKSDFPSRHDWDSFFRDAKHMNEMKAGERPDTLHLFDLPNKWFSTKSKEDVPSENLLKKIFQQFGEVTAVDIPSIDPYRSKMKAHLSGMKLFNFHQNLTFEAYVQFKDYISFVKAMDYFRGMKLLRIESDQAYTSNIKVDFDKTKHLSENSIRKRKIEREKLMAKGRELEEKKQQLEESLKKLEETEKEQQQIKEIQIKSERKKKKDEKRKKRLESKTASDLEEDVSIKILNEKKLLLAAQRKLESIRLLTELLKIIEEEKKRIIKVEGNQETLTSEATKNGMKLKDNNTEEIISNEKIQSEIVLSDRESNLNNSRDGKKLQSEVVKIEKSVLDCRFSRDTLNSNKPTYYPNVHYKSRRRSERPWHHNERHPYGGRSRSNNSRRERLKANNEYYYRNTHHLYYKYFQSLTRNDRGKRSISRSRSRSKSGEYTSKSRSSRSSSVSSRSDKSRPSVKRRRSPKNSESWFRK